MKIVGLAILGEGWEGFVRGVVIGERGEGGEVIWGGGL